jgi:hypothetical protein
MNTVAEMRDVAKRMNLSGTSKLRKSDLYAAIVAGIETAHAEALEMDRIRTMMDAHIASEVKLAETRKGKSFDDRMRSRVNGYMVQRNGGKLTPKQAQRIGKKIHAHAARAQRSK